MNKKLQKISLATTGALASLQVWAGTALAAPTTVSAPTGFFSDIGSLINQILKFVMVISALLVFMYLIWGGIEWITSGGDKGKTESARNKITSAVIGLIVVASAFAILQLALTFLGLGDINELLRTVSPSYSGSALQGSGIQGGGGGR